MRPAADGGPRTDVAVRYLPAVGTLNVCGDWYDLVELSDTRPAVAVGDVVGHGLAAAGVMGQLRSALSRGDPGRRGPRAGAAGARPLRPLRRRGAGRHPVQVVIDRARQMITYSCAGHLPPVPLQPDGTVHFLDQATDPPWASPWPTSHGPGRTCRTRPAPPSSCTPTVSWNAAGRTSTTARAASPAAFAGIARLDPERLAEALLSDLGVADGAEDDTALVIIRL
ncbi:hypothetical protein Airi01_042060 [Actinoallomurus iriomotensis]|uniref:PPM-type phosphatase domain-containing protein n=1 Tax=Actinoallomurus iriomotensis TaxID=478107 RepID=A0A9W6VQJ4_9ACTN|nr:SpoIIE family protein phosphatase [Actinoallomurus iriomotensis]GLY75939.1 hypothetical protein Airi01_042060 [Actinoallomurus iriomotensis]